jgi:hypothetical protein
MHNVSVKKMELISLIKQVKTKMKKSPKKKLDIEFHEIFCELVENVVLNFSDGDLSNHVIDNYSLAQISLCSIVVQWITTKGEVVLEKKEINKVFEIIHNFIKKEYGQEFFELIKIIGLYDHNKLKEIISPKEAISNASIIIKNVHPSYLNGSINAFILVFLPETVGKPMVETIVELEEGNDILTGNKKILNDDEDSNIELKNIEDAEKDKIIFNDEQNIIDQDKGEENKDE